MLLQWGLRYCRQSDASEFTPADYNLRLILFTLLTIYSHITQGMMSKASSVIFGPLPAIKTWQASPIFSPCQLALPQRGWVFLFIFSSSPSFSVWKTLDQANAFFSIRGRCACPQPNVYLPIICNHDLKTWIPIFRSHGGNESLSFKSLSLK